MLPRLEAEERLAAITDGSVASGFAERSLARDTFGALEQAAGIVRPKPAKANPRALAAMGIGVRAPSMPSQEAVSDG